MHVLATVGVLCFAGEALYTGVPQCTLELGSSFSCSPSGEARASLYPELNRWHEFSFAARERLRKVIWQSASDLEPRTCTVQVLSVLPGSLQLGGSKNAEAVLGFLILGLVTGA
jgi:hypothetical protein